MPTEQSYAIGSWREFVSPNGIGVTLDPGKTALIIVDMQRRIADRRSPRGLARQFPKIDPAQADGYFTNLEQRVVPNIRRLLDYCRARGMPVIHFVMGGNAPGGEDKPFSLWGPHTRAHGAEEVGLIVASDPEFQIIDELEPAPNEFVVHKFTQNGFIGTAVHLVLRNLGIEELVFTGGATNGCVEGTARGAADSGFKVGVVEDAVSLVAMFDGEKGNFALPFLHDATMINFCSFIGRVTTTDELLAEWAARSSDQPVAAGRSGARPGG